MSPFEAWVLKGGKLTPAKLEHISGLKEFYICQITNFFLYILKY